MQVHNVSPDLRVAIPKESQQVIVDIVSAGKSTAAVAAEIKVSQRRIQQIVLKDKKQRVRVSKSQAAAAEAEALADQNIIHGDYRTEGKRCSRWVSRVGFYGSTV